MDQLIPIVLTYMARRYCWILIAFLNLTPNLQAQIPASLGVYEFNGYPTTLGYDLVSSAESYANFSPFTFTSGTLSQLNYQNAFLVSGWSLELDMTKFLSYSFSIDPGEQITLSELRFDQVRNSSGPTLGRVDLFVNGSVGTPYASYEYTISDFLPERTLKPQTFDFPDVSGVTSAELRFYAYATGTGPFGVDNVRVMGAPVPEPAAWGAIAALGLLVFAVGRQARRSLLRGALPAGRNPRFERLPLLRSER